MGIEYIYFEVSNDCVSFRNPKIITSEDYISVSKEDIDGMEVIQFYCNGIKIDEVLLNNKIIYTKYSLSVSEYRESVLGKHLIPLVEKIISYLLRNKNLNEILK
jgi:hypothetical protein